MAYRNNFLFSEAYVKDAIKAIKCDTTASDEMFDNVCSWYQEYKRDWSLFEEITIDTLGFEKTKDGDYYLLNTNDAHPVALLYAIAEDCDVESTIKGKYYSVDAVKKAVDRDVAWVIVTNGRRWRLMSVNGISPYEYSFSVDIGDALDSGKPDETTHIFTFFFGAENFKKDSEGNLLMDSFKEKSDRSEENVEDVLRSKAESILTKLCYGLKDGMNKLSFSEPERKQIYEEAIILLYRLLFLGYAEARDLLPVKEDDPDYTESFSKLCETAKSYHLGHTLADVADEYDLWERLDSQLRIYVDKNYNGGLFSNEDKPILKEYRIANRHLAPCLMELAYIAGRREDYSQKIEYKDLSVRNLGAIYEGLLEYQLFIADELMVHRKSKEKVTYIKAADTTLKNSDKNNLVQPGEIYLSQDAMERKETGAYYTPEDVVDYIVKNTVGKRLEELRARLDDELKDIRDELSYEPVESRRQLLQREVDEKTIDFIEENILSLSIVDSAMGSGHFLVNAAYRVSNFIVDILEGNHWENDDINADVTYWRRRVVENCIYGIDINNLSVLLARLSLWLISVTNDKALSFIDHHLKCGNSIIGTTTDKVSYVDKEIPLFNVGKDQYMMPILKKYKQIKEIGSDTKADVAMQQDVYEDILSDLAVVKRKLDYYLASMYAGGISDNAEFREVMYADDISFFATGAFKELFDYADSNQFFHWDLEFPEVFMKGGFDIYIGNPPYVEADSSQYIGITRTNECHNLYTYILENTLRNCGMNAAFGVILPSACTSTPRMAPFQQYLIDITQDVRFAIFDDRPGKLFTRLQHMRAAIITGVKGKRVSDNIQTTKYIRWFSNERKNLFSNISYAPTSYYDLVEGNIPKVANPIENTIIAKIFSCERTIESYIDESHADNGVYYGYGVQYWIKAMYKSADEIDSGARKSTGEKEMHFKYEVDAKIFSLILNSNLFYWYFVLFSDCRNLTRTVISRFPIDISAVSEEDKDLLIQLSEELLDDYISNSNLKTANYVGKGEIVYREYSVRKSKPIIDKADKVIGRIYGLTDQEINYITNYDVRFRIGED